MKVKSESEVAQPCPTLKDPMDCSPPGSLVLYKIQVFQTEQWPVQCFLVEPSQSLCFFQAILITPSVLNLNNSDYINAGWIFPFYFDYFNKAFKKMESKAL